MNQRLNYQDSLVDFLFRGINICSQVQFLLPEHNVQKKQYANCHKTWSIMSFSPSILQDLCSLVAVLNRLLKKSAPSETTVVTE